MDDDVQFWEQDEPRGEPFDWPRREYLYLQRDVYSDEEWRSMGPHEAGRTYRSHYGAPGCGHHDTFCTRVDEHGVWGYTVSDTLHILEPWEVV